MSTVPKRRGRPPKPKPIPAVVQPDATPALAVTQPAQLIVTPVIKRIIKSKVIQPALAVIQPAVVKPTLPVVKSPLTSNGVKSVKEDKPVSETKIEENKRLKEFLSLKRKTDGQLRDLSDLTFMDHEKKTVIIYEILKSYFTLYYKDGFITQSKESNVVLAKLASHIDTMLPLQLLLDVILIYVDNYDMLYAYKDISRMIKDKSNVAPIN